MARQKNIVRLEGNLGGISFYKSGGEYLAREANGPDKKKIENSPQYVRVRENNREFGGAANTGKAFRKAFAEVVRVMGDHYFSARLTQLFKKICQLGPGVRGERTIRPTEFGGLLQGVDFSKALTLGSLMSAPYTLTVNAQRNEATLDIPDIAPGLYLGPPAGATHFKVLLALGMVSNHAYEAEARMYAPVEPSHNAIGVLAQTASLPLHTTAGASPVSVTATFAGAPTPSADVAVIACMGIIFYQQVNGVDYPLGSNKAMQVVKVV